MRSELVALLAEAKVSGSQGKAFPWDRVVLVRSRGSLVRRNQEPEPNIADRGFHLIMLSEAGAPEFYCKCRPRRPDGTRHRDSEVLSILAADPESRSFVPQAVFASNARIDLQVTAYVHGTPLDLVMPNLAPPERWVLAEEVLRVGGVLVAALRRQLDARGEAASTSLAVEAGPLMKALPSMGLTRGDRVLIERVFREVGAVPALPQHGDFWPQNVLRSPAGALCVVDMDGFGILRVPLYDTLHFLRTARESARPQVARPWTAHLAAADEHGSAMRRLLAGEAARCGLGPDEVGACALFYVVAVAATTFLRDVPQSIWGPFRNQIPPTCERIRDLGSIGAYGSTLLRS